MLRNGDFKYFRGRESYKLTTEGKRLESDKWYFEPADYEGDAVYSDGFDTLRDALKHADDLLKSM